LKKNKSPSGGEGVGNWRGRGEDGRGEEENLLLDYAFFTADFFVSSIL
jgi:hypothetical protein